ncbi:hypothetical protein CYLTODRAFT_376736 [Cylindrobasidium torrendii FP15055 ss-10]|uniref:SWIM-type domain-containing protein n=1 Tax=Cylindrobasidium torrendii FP15055 ss-10 TaxID=1314674 RepID=A0A0D7BA10_9AGAR|nr:hypothetical protein CYLTODRAFT_376736 [Cylindrobasidium torrendii FP15055 ss-10]
MPLLKRKANGEYEAWRKSSPAPTSSPARPAETSSPDIPAPAKRARIPPPFATPTALTTRPGVTSVPGYPLVGLVSSRTLAPAIGSSASPQASASAPTPNPRRTAAPFPMAVSRPKSPSKPAPVAKPAPKPKTSTEKRQGRYRSSAPRNIMDRYSRVLTQRFFMVARRREGGELKETFLVLGSTGNVYTVTIDHVPRCDCPDALKDNRCKHIILVFLKVLQVPVHSPHWYQKALLTDELEEIFAAAPPAPNDTASQRVRDAYAVATGSAPAASSSSSSTTKRKIPTEEDTCAICYDNMHSADMETSLEWCETCGNALHKVCFGQWRAAAARKGDELTCVYCRAPWATFDARGGGVRIGDEGYLNLGGVAGVSRVRDESSYYRSPPRRPVGRGRGPWGGRWTRNYDIDYYDDEY